MRGLSPQFAMVVLCRGRSRFLALLCSLGLRRTLSATGGVRLRPPRTPTKGRNGPWNPNHSDKSLWGIQHSEVRSEAN